MAQATDARTRGGAPRIRAVVAVLVVGVARLLVWWRWLVSERGPGDVEYYFTSTQALPTTGIATTLVEYPAPVAWLLGIPQLLAPGDLERYLTVFVTMMLAADLALCWALWRRTPRPLLAVGAWSAFLASLGTIDYLRFDMVPAALVGLALVLVADRPRLAGALIGLGAAIKLWPALILLPLLALPRRARQIQGFVAAGGGLAALSLALTGWGRTVSPLTWQSDRGLQIESVWATPLMVARARGGPQEVVMSAYKAFEVSGAGVDAWLAWSSLATLAGAVALGAVLYRGLRNTGALAADEHIAARLRWSAWTAVAITAVVIVGNKTLSPQYLVWLGAPVVVAIAHEPRVRWRRAATGTLLLSGALTHLVFPTWYPWLWADASAHQVIRATTALALRNTVLLVSAVVATCAVRHGPTYRTGLRWESRAGEIR